MDDPNLSDAALLKRVALGERQVHDTLAAIRRLAGETGNSTDWLEQLYGRLGCTENESKREREKKLRSWLSQRTTGDGEP